MNNSNLIDGKIYKGFYAKNDKNYFCYFVIDETKTQAVDIFTNKRFKIYDFTLIEYNCDGAELKYIRKVYKNNKNTEIFIQKTTEEDFNNYNYNKILRFFELSDYTDIFKSDIDQKILVKVVEKIQKYSKRYIGNIQSVEYAKQLKNASNIFEILTFIPADLTNIKVPFWINILKENLKYFPIVSYTLSDIKEYNKHDLNIFINYKNKDLNKKIIQDKIKNIQYLENFNYEQKCKNKILDRLKEARLTLDNEFFIASQTKDDDLIFEINIIKEELQKVEDNICNINFYEPVIEWWPDLLYPIPFIEPFERDENIIFELERITDHFPYIL